MLPLPSSDGKISAAQVEAAFHAHWDDATHEHMVQPALVYISHPTELGTLYTRTELEALHDVCRRCGLLLYVDGARLGYGLAAPGSDVDLPLLACCADAFYIGGTKVGALFTDMLYLRAGRRAVDAALRIRRAFEQAGIPMLVDSPTNQQFPVLTDAQLAALSERFAFSFWARLDDGRAAVRVCTSWATTDAQADALCAAVRAL